MTSLGLGDVARFPFVDPPDRRQVTAGVQLLEELGALEAAPDLLSDLDTLDFLALEDVPRVAGDPAL
jgi:HrpA-like RNA helicase